jgi:hypothetical protein
MAYLEPHIKPPTLTRPPGSKDPKVNGCGGEFAQFVYCNFNKHLKFSPDTFNGWLNILEVLYPYHGSIILTVVLCVCLSAVLRRSLDLFFVYLKTPVTLLRTFFNTQRNIIPH